MLWEPCRRHIENTHTTCPSYWGNVRNTPGLWYPKTAHLSYYFSLQQLVNYPLVFRLEYCSIQRASLEFPCHDLRREFTDCYCKCTGLTIVNNFCFFFFFLVIRVDFDIYLSTGIISQDWKSTVYTAYSPIQFQPKVLHVNKHWMECSLASFC